MLLGGKCNAIHWAEHIAMVDKGQKLYALAFEWCMYIIKGGRYEKESIKQIMIL